MCKFIKYIISGFCFFTYISTATEVFANNVLQKNNATVTIKAVVNQNIITSADLEYRLQMISSLFNRPMTPATQKLFEKQILRSMIDEQLQIQAAQKSNVTVDKKAVSAAIERIEKSRGMYPGQIKEKLEKINVPYSTLENQIHANLLWLELVNYKFKPLVHITEHEINAYIEKQKKQASKPHYHVQEIFLLTNEQAPIEQAKLFANNLKKQINSGADFGALAQQFSDATSAVQGGSLGWIGAGELDDLRNEVITSLRVGEVSDPIIANGGVYLLILNDKKEPQYDTSYILDYAEMFVPLFFIPNEKALHDKIEEVRSLSKQVRSLKDLEKVAKEYGANFEKYNEKNMLDLSSDLQERLSNLPIKTPSSVYRSPTGLHVFLVEKREKKKMLRGIETKQEAQTSLLNKKLENSANAYLRQLRRKSHLKQAL